SASVDATGKTAELPDDPGLLLDHASAHAQPVDVAAAGEPAADSGKAIDNVDSSDGKQTKRILYIVPNFRAVSVDSQPPAQPIKDKLITAAEDSFDYSSFVFVGLQAGVGMMGKSYPEFRQGTAGYSRYYWHTFADSVDENLWVEFLIPSALRQDTRYYTLGRGGVIKRFAYSFSRIAITRTDEGHEAFNASEILGAGTAAAISNFYYPTAERTEVKTYQRWVTNVVIDGGFFVFKEFWPDINSAFFHQKD
ncbi:MAG TPA: hypothetical protein VGR71_12185, partial [Nitrospira sp.]|nr:hypothetical protein [Nitrospira sp.]